MANILLVCREWATRALIRAELEEEGYQATGVEDLSEALFQAESGICPAELIILDTVGQSLREEALERLRQTGIATIVCAGPFDLTQVDFRRFGLSCILVKPLFIGDLVDKVKEVLPRQ